MKKTKKVLVVSGGYRRQDSVKNGLLFVSSRSQLVCIHDGARPFVSEKLIKQSIIACSKNHLKEWVFFDACAHWGHSKRQFIDETNKSLLDDNVNRVLRERRPAQELTTEELDKHREFTKNFVKKALWSKKD